jgi:outer membrane murein-binding lipoprotein Lpp
MNKTTSRYKLILSLIGLLAIFSSSSVLAGGEVGDHVNHLSENLNKYTKEVNWLIKKVDDIVSRYEKKGTKEANAKAVIEHWEAVDFHAAIESNYVPVYALIWQGLYAVKESIDNNSSIESVKAEQTKLEEVLWQALGAVKLAAQFQERGLLEKVALREGGPSNSLETVDEIKARLNIVVAKFAEKLVKKSIDIVHDTYLTLFEGIEGDLISMNAELVEELEKDFNVTLPLALKGKSSVKQIQKIVISMNKKLTIARDLLTKKKQNKKDIF